MCKSLIREKDSLGKTIGWNFTVTLNSITTAGVIQNQLLTVRLVGTKWVVNKVLDRDHANTLIATAIFSYNTAAVLARYNRLGTLLSTTYVRRPAGGTPFYEIVTVAGIKKTLSITTPFSQILKEAAKIKG